MSAAPLAPGELPPAVAVVADAVAASGAAVPPAGRVLAALLSAIVSLTFGAMCSATM